LSQLEDEADLQLARQFCANFGCCPVKLLTQPHKKVDPPAPPAPDRFDLVFDRSPQSIVYFDKMVYLDAQGVLVQIKSRAKSQISGWVPDYSDVVFLSKTSQFAFLHERSGFITISGQTTTQVIAHKGSPILCMAEVCDELLVTAGADCLLHVWRAPDFRPIEKIPVHSTAITAIAANRILNTVACVNVSQEVIIADWSERKSILSFAIACEPEDRHRILLLDNGLLIISCENEQKSGLLFFNLRGKSLGAIELEGKLVKMFPIVTRSLEASLVLSMEGTGIGVVDCSRCALTRKLDVRPHPRLVMGIDDKRRLLVVMPGESKLTPVAF
jgi:hypothetical protein